MFAFFSDSKKKKTRTKSRRKDEDSEEDIEMDDYEDEDKENRNNKPRLPGRKRKQNITQKRKVRLNPVFSSDDEDLFE